MDEQPTLPVDEDVWQQAWPDAWSRYSARWSEAWQNHDVHALWKNWSSALESAGGISNPQRHKGTVVVPTEVVWKGPDSTRMPHLQRRLHRVWRRCRELLRQAELGRYDASLLQVFLGNIHALQSQGVLDENANTGNLADLEKVLTSTIAVHSQRGVEDRLDQWKAQAKAPGLAKLFQSLSCKPRPGLLAVPGLDGKLTADPGAVQAYAQSQWARKNHPALDEDLRQAYLHRVLPHIQPCSLDASVDDTFSMNELISALKSCKGTAPGPGQWAAEALLKAPPEALKLLLQLMQLICDTGAWPEALRLQEVTMIPKRPGSEDLRPISVTSVITRALEKMVLSRYKKWIQLVQPTDVTEVLLSVEGLIAEARSADGHRLFRQSDLSNCFTRLDPQLCKQLAISFGMRPQHAATLFDMNRSHPAIIRAGAAVGDWCTPERGMAQGDPISPMAAALMAGAHARVLKVEVPRASFFTYVDDRTLSTSTVEDMRSATELLSHLDQLSGQMEDSAKEEYACVGFSQEEVRGFPDMNFQFLDLLGIRMCLQSAAWEVSPKALGRWEQLQVRVRRLRSLSGGLRLSRDQLLAVVSATMGLVRWDAAWLLQEPPDLFKVTTSLELALQGRRRHVAWRHRGASWLMHPRGWLVEPHAIRWWSLVKRAQKLRFSQWSSVFTRAWTLDDGLSGCLASRIRDAYRSLGWQPTASPFTVRLPSGLCDLGLVSGATLGHALRHGWRTYIMQNYGPSRRHVSVDIHALDVAPIHKFLALRQDPNPALSWRCAVAAEPNLERLAHLADVDKHCPACPGRPIGTTFHMDMMWECVKTADLRRSFGLDLRTASLDLQGVSRDAWLQNAWTEFTPFPQQLSWTMDVLRSWIDELKALFLQHPPVQREGEFLVATDGSACHPEDADCRQAACAVAWRSASGIQVWSRALEVETTVNAAELSAVVVGATAADATSFSPVRLLTDHVEIVRRGGVSTIPVRAGKEALWEAWFALVRRGSSFASWVPSHRKALHLDIPEEWRILNHHADVAAGRCAAAAAASKRDWCANLRARRELAVKILRYKRAAFADSHALLLQSMRA